MPPRSASAAPWAIAPAKTAHTMRLQKRKRLPPPWRAAPRASTSFAQVKLSQPTPPPWKRAALPEHEQTMESSSHTADAPGWRAMHPSSVLERAAQPTPPPWKRKASKALPPHTQTSSPAETDAFRWRKRAATTDVDPSLSLSRSA
ncbi:hypothetical protein MVEN_00805600 [Mycena venus]|uniref:Uncharacterized protein n=1 Tax=Mycena venus TaxID=2733690 RepID=A0A8H6YKI3_9AGAR|nr:hypothetical protein MVEN_00805600 [Mycena venus]